MITYKCKNCAGEVSINYSGDLACPYCGTKVSFSDKELEGYKEFRRKMLEYLASVSNNTERDSDLDYIWSMAEEIDFESESGETISVRYIYKSERDSVHMYCARNNVILVFPDSKCTAANRTLSTINGLKYPKADMRGLDRLVPNFAGKYNLKDGSILLAYSKPDDMLPLPLFGNLAYEHVAWIVSRLENIACLLCFNNLAHHDIDPDSVFINPKTHEAALYGGWCNTTESESGSTDDLKAIRNTAKLILGPGFEDIPKMFIEFIKERPKKNAYEDFEYWDEVIEKGLGGRHFHKLDINSLK